MRAALFLLLLLALPARAEVGFDPRFGAQVPAQTAFREAPLARYLERAPVVLVLGYGTCVNLCGTTVEGVAQALAATGLAAGRDYEALFVSIDPRDERAPPEPRAGWHVLTGAAAAAKVAKAVGFRYAWERESGEFAHPAGFVVLTPRGKVARYFPGVRFDAGELRRALADAGRGETAQASGFEQLLLRCFHDPESGRYTATVLAAVRIAMLCLLALAGVLAWRRLR